MRERAQRFEIQSASQPPPPQTQFIDSPGSHTTTSILNDILLPYQGLWAVPLSSFGSGAKQATLEDSRSTSRPGRPHMTQLRWPFLENPSWVVSCFWPELRDGFGAPDLVKEMLLLLNGVNGCEVNLHLRHHFDAAGVIFRSVPERHVDLPTMRSSRGGYE